MGYRVRKGEIEKSFLARRWEPMEADTKISLGRGGSRGGILLCDVGNLGEGLEAGQRRGDSSGIGPSAWGRSGLRILAPQLGCLRLPGLVCILQ